MQYHQTFVEVSAHACTANIGYRLAELDLDKIWLTWLVASECLLYSNTCAQPLVPILYETLKKGNVTSSSLQPTIMKCVDRRVRAHNHRKKNPFWCAELDRAGEAANHDF